MERGGREAKGGEREEGRECSKEREGIFEGKGERGERAIKLGDREVRERGESEGRERDKSKVIEG